MPALAATALGIVLGLAAGGSFHGLSAVPIRGGVAIVVLYCLQAVARGRALGLQGVPRLALALWVASSMVLVLILLLDWRSPGPAIVATGVSLNLLVVIMNGGMPVEPTQLGDAVGQLVELPIAHSGFYQLAGTHTLAAPLGDVLLVKIGQSALLLSVGDVLLIVGVCTWIVSAMCALGTRGNPDPGI